MTMKYFKTTLLACALLFGGDALSKCHKISCQKTFTLDSTIAILTKNIACLTAKLQKIQQKSGIISSYFVLDKTTIQFVRAITSTTTASGQSAIGTELTDPVIRATLLAGNTFEGNIVLFGVNYAAKYVPLKDNLGNVIGSVAAAQPI